MNRRNVMIGGAIGAVALTLAISGSRGGLRIVEHDGSITGTGSSGSPLELVSVATLDSGVFSGTGSAGSSLSVDLTETDNATFGDGSDGVCSFDGSTTVLGLAPGAFTSTNPPISGGQAYSLTRDIFCTNATVSSNVYVRVEGFRVHVSGTLTLNGYLGRVGNNGNGSSGGAQYAVTAFLGQSESGGGGGATDCVSACVAGGAITPAHQECATAAAAGAISTGTAAQSGGRCLGGGGGSLSGTTGSCPIGTAGCAAGGATLSGSTTIHWLHTPFSAFELRAERISTSTRIQCGSGGGGAKGASAAGRGGGGGAGGGCVAIFARMVTGSGTITARGGNGATGVGGSGLHGGGGGGGGGGGVATVVIGGGNFPTVDVDGGTAGVPGTGSSTTGLNAGDGGDGVSQLFRAGYN